MPDPSPTTPPGLLLATDLSARCDRPLERAKQLAGEFSIPLAVLAAHDAPQAPGEVLPWRDGDAGRALHERAAREDFAREFAGSMLLDPVVGEGEAASQLARHVVDNSVDLVVLGLHEESALMRLLTGSRSEYLLQAVVCDTLLVRPPARPGEDDENEKT